MSFKLDVHCPQPMEALLDWALQPKWVDIARLETKREAAKRILRTPSAYEPWQVDVAKVLMEGPVLQARIRAAAAASAQFIIEAADALEEDP